MHENYKYIYNIDDCIYINYIEVNRFFRQKGVYKFTVQSLIQFVDLNKNIILTNETKDGEKCRT